MDQSLTLTGEGYAIAIAPECLTRRADLLARSAHIVAVNDDGGAETAREALKALKAFENAAERSRESIKAPVLEVGRRIDAAAKTLLESVRAESARLANLVKGYAVLCDQKRREAEDAARRAAFEAERQRKAAAQAAEAERIAAERAAMQSDRAAMEAAEAARLGAEKARRDAEIEQNKAGMLAMRSQAAAAPAGVKPVLDYQIDDMHALAMSRPDLVVITERRKELLALIRSGESAPSGVRVVQNFSVSTR